MEVEVEANPAAVPYLVLPLRDDGASTHRSPGDKAPAGGGALERPLGDAGRR